MPALDVRTERAAVSDIVRPPAGYRLDACLGTTYSLEFDAFTGLLLALVGVEVEDGTADPAAVLTTLASLHDRLRVYVNAGSLDPPATAHRMFGRYDRLLRPVHLEGAAFHPKVWVLKFVPLERPERHRPDPVFRILCGSRNATAASTWELGVALDGKPQDATTAFGTELARFLRVVTSGRPAVPAAIAAMLDELPRVRFDGGREGLQDLRFEWQWPGRRTLQSALPQKATRAILISPFLRAPFVEHLSAAVGDLTVVSTQVELDALPDSTHAGLKQAKVFVVSGQGDDDVPALDLHAKLLVWEAGSLRETLVGSANGTTSAWGLGRVRNCEAMVALRPGLQVAEVVRAFVSPQRDTLHGWIERYERQSETPSDEDLAQREIDAAVRQIAGASLVGTYDRDLHLLGLRAAPGSALPTFGPPLSVDVVPLLQQQTGRWQPFSGLSAGLRFPDVALADLAAFALVRVAHRAVKNLDHTVCVQFTLDLPEGGWDARDDAMNARLLEGIDARQVLLNVLQGRAPGLSASPHGKRGGSASTGSLLARVTIERVLESCTADPTRVPQVDAVLRACGAVPELDAFREFWANLLHALREEQTRG